MNKFNAESFNPLDEEEQALMDSLESEAWQAVANLEQEKEKAVAAARRTIRKDKRINLRLTQKDYYEIQIRAIEEGVPYQTLIASIVHKYLNGTLTAQE
jgi:predicted DNA binding CopG/RHH family protein